MSSPMRSVGRAAIWLAAANFVALVVMIASLAATGAVSPARWRSALQVLRGSARAVSVEEYDRLRAAAAKKEPLLAQPVVSDIHHRIAIRQVEGGRVQFDPGSVFEGPHRILVAAAVQKPQRHRGGRLAVIDVFGGHR